MKTPKVAPHESCLGCYRGDTTTAVAFQGEADFIVTAIHKAAGLSLDEAAATLGIAEVEFGGEPGMVPGGDVSRTIRLCRDCAQRASVQVGELAGGELPCYRQPGYGGNG